MKRKRRTNSLRLSTHTRYSRNPSQGNSTICLARTGLRWVRVVRVRVVRVAVSIKEGTTRTFFLSSLGVVAGVLVIRTCTSTLEEWEEEWEVEPILIPRRSSNQSHSSQVHSSMR